MNELFQLDDTNKIQALTGEKNGCHVFHISLSKLFARGITSISIRLL